MSGKSPRPAGPPQRLPRPGARFQWHRACLLAALICALPAVASLAAADASSAQDVVVLTDGTRLVGDIIDMKRGVFVTVQLASGARRTVSWAQVKDVLQQSVAPVAPSNSSSAPYGSAMPAPATPSSSAPTPETGCTKDTDCKGDRICEAGRCIDVQPAPTATAIVAGDTPPVSPADMRATAAALDATARNAETLQTNKLGCSAKMTWTGEQLTLQEELAETCKRWIQSESMWRQDDAWSRAARAPAECNSSGGLGEAPSQYHAYCSTCSEPLDATIAALRSDAARLRAMAQLVECTIATERKPQPVPPVPAPIPSDTAPQQPADEEAIYRPTRPNPTLLTLGIVGLAVGYGLAATAATIGAAAAASDHSQYGVSCADASPWSFIPLVGPALTLANYPSSQLATFSQGSPYVLNCAGPYNAVASLVVTDEVLQVGGLGLILLGVGLRVPATTAGVPISVMPGGPGGPIGVTIRGAAF